MLVLRRRAGESLFIGDDVEIELLAVTAQGAKIGIRAPKDTIVLRKELKITQEQNAEAAQGLPHDDIERAVKKLRGSTQDPGLAQNQPGLPREAPDRV
jgi:carbon storage regulator